MTNIPLLFSFSFLQNRISNMLLFAILVLILVLLFLKNSIFSDNKHNMIPPGPNTIQVLKNLRELKKNPHVSFKNLSETYGPLMSLRLGGQLVIVVSSSSLAKQVLKTHDSTFSGRYLPSLLYKVPGVTRSVMSMAIECDETWKSLRVLSHGSVFSSKSVADDIRKEKSRELVNYLRSREGQVLELDDVMNTIMGNILSCTMASTDIFDISGGDDNRKVRGLFRENVEMFSSLGVADLFPILKKVDFWNKKRGVQILNNIMALWECTLEQRRAKRRHSSDDEAKKDYLDVLIENGFRDAEIAFAVMELLIAGTDTSSITSIWLMVELLRHPNSLQRVRQEIANAFKQEEDASVVDEQTLTQSRYFQACIKETLRLHIAGPLLIPHRAIKTCKIDDRFIVPKECVVLINAWAIGREPGDWNSDAELFKPERFLDSKIDYKGSSFEFIPFGAGRRMCPGMNLATRNIQLVVASLLHYFDWSLRDYGDDFSKIDMSEKFGTVLKNERPIYLVPQRR